MDYEKDLQGRQRLLKEHYDILSFFESIIKKQPNTDNYDEATFEYRLGFAFALDDFRETGGEERFLDVAEKNLNILLFLSFYILKRLLIDEIERYEKSLGSQVVETIFPEYFEKHRPFIFSIEHKTPSVEWYDNIETAFSSVNLSPRSMVDFIDDLTFIAEKFKKRYNF